jgi:hypothetical protein
MSHHGIKVHVQVQLSIVISLCFNGLELMVHHGCSDAACNGHLAVLKWARANEEPWDILTGAHAALNGHLDGLQWARAPWDIWTCAKAAEGGHRHLDVLKWARENGAPWDENTCINAVRNKHNKLLLWAKNNGAPLDNWIFYITRNEISN